VEHLAEVGLAQPAVHALAGLDAHDSRHVRRRRAPLREIDLAESALAEALADAVFETGFRADEALTGFEQWTRGLVACGSSAQRSRRGGRGVSHGRSRPVRNLARIRAWVAGVRRGRAYALQPLPMKSASTARARPLPSRRG